MGNLESIALTAVAVLLPLGCCAWLLISRGRQLETRQRTEEIGFEKSVLNQYANVEPPEKTEATEAALEAVDRLVRTVQAPQPALAEGGEGAGWESGIEEDEFAEAAGPAGEPVATPGPLAEAVIARLETAGVLQNVEGPLHTSNPLIRGTVLRLRGGKMLAVQETPLLTDDPAQVMVLRLHEGVVTAGPGGEPLYVKRLQSLIGEMFSR